MELMLVLENSAVSDYHAHIYFCDDTVGEARDLIKAIREKYNFKIGRFHEKLVGPHLNWSCQIKFSQIKFGQFVPWLMVNRGELNIFIHLCSDDALLDHSKFVCWLGKSQPLKLDMFK
jgi:aromatic ring-cleaving dioxygenase